MHSLGMTNNLRIDQRTCGEPHTGGYSTSTINTFQAAITYEDINNGNKYAREGLFDIEQF
jgi:hypothetical protein